MAYGVGQRVTEWLSEAEITAAGDAPRSLGQTLWTHDGKCYVYVQLGTGGVTGDGYVCAISAAHEAVMLSTSNDAVGVRIGIAEGAGVEDDFGWLQVYGPCGVRTEQDALASNFMAATSDAGQLDDAGAAGTFVVGGLILGTATGGADAVNTTGFANFPMMVVVPAVA